MTNTACILTLLLTLLAMGCHQEPSSGLPTVQMSIGSKSYTLEVATTSAQQETGLMRRDSMPADHGMIFVFAKEEPRRFWMKDTRIPLDILYIDAAGKIVSIHTMKPYDESGVPSGGAILYAIELNAGQAAATGVKPGDTLSIPALPK